MWTFVLNGVEFRDMGEVVKVEKVKVVACDGKGLCGYVNFLECHRNEFHVLN